MNKVHLIGNLVKDPDLRYTKQNTPVASYTVAINTRYGENQQTDYINISTWGKGGEFIKKYFKKGQPIAITGRLKNKNYEDSNGIKHYSIEVITEDIEFVGAKKEEIKSETKEKVKIEPKQEEFTPNFSYEDDELPF